MNIDKLKEVDKLTKEILRKIISGVLGYSGFSNIEANAMRTTHCLLQSYISALESGLPERERLHGPECWNPDCAEWKNCYDLMLPHIVARNMKIKELEERLKDGK